MSDAPLPAEDRVAARRTASALVASRICHDLVGPLGAIANGLELMSLAGAASPEADLIAESVAAATARLRFFRLAYGLAGKDQQTSRKEVTATLQSVARGGRTSYEWLPQGNCPRIEVRPVLLLLQCLETAMPLGGHVRVERGPAGWSVIGQGHGMRIDRGLWLGLQGPHEAAPDEPGLVHFALLPDLLDDLGRALLLDLGTDRIAARF